MDAIKAYRETLSCVMEKAFNENGKALEQGAELLARATLEGHNIFAFGCSHAMLPMFELYYRTGGMATINPVRAPGLSLDVDPATMTSHMERIPGYGKIIVDANPLGKDDVIIVHSVSGRNTVPIDVALEAKKRGVHVIVITSLEMTNSVTSRHPDGIKLYETAEVLIDNCGCVGDAAVEVPGVPEKVGPTSTAVAVALLNAMMTQAVDNIVRAGATAPVFISANVDGGDEHNTEMMKKYGEHIFYM